jgi:hypothetical protein
MKRKNQKKQNHQNKSTNTLEPESWYVKTSLFLTVLIILSYDYVKYKFPTYYHADSFSVLSTRHKKSTFFGKINEAFATPRPLSIFSVNSSSCSMPSCLSGFLWHFFLPHFFSSQSYTWLNVCLAWWIKCVHSNLWIKNLLKLDQVERQRGRDKATFFGNCFRSL